MPSACKQKSARMQQKRDQKDIYIEKGSHKQIKTQKNCTEIMLGMFVCYRSFNDQSIILLSLFDFIQQHLELRILTLLYKQYIPNIVHMNRPETNSSDSIDPEFLTFRHNSPQALLSSGRTIYSHRFDYKSLQKYPIFDGSNSQRQDVNERTHKKIKHSVKQKQMRTVKSQEKYKQLFSPLAYNVEDSQEDKQQQVKARGIANQDEIRKYQDGKHLKYYKQKGQTNQTKVFGSQANLQKNIDLKSKLSKLIKSMRKQQRKQFTLQQQIQEISADVQDLDKQIEDQQHNINELKQISEENVKECNRIIESIRKISSRNQEIASNLQSLEESVNNSQFSMETYKQDETKDRIICARLKEGMGDLLKMKNSAEMRVRRLEQQIQLMQCQMQMMKNQEVEMGKILGLSCQSKYHNFSQNQSHSHNSHNSSSGSN